MKKKFSFFKKNYDKYKKEHRFCERTGLLGSTSEDFIYWQSFGLDSSHFHTLRLPISTSVDCLRLFYSELKGYKIPQLSMYVPKSGWPLCDPKYSSQYAKGGYWPGKLSKYYVELPFNHISYGLLPRKNVLHHYSVFQAKGLGSYSKKNLTLNNPTIFKNYKDSSYAYCPGDKNSVKGIGYFQSLAVGNELMKEFGNKPTFEQEMFFTIRVTPNGSDTLLNNQGFENYLAYWFLMYPNKHCTFKDSTANRCGDLVGKNQGYWDYCINSKDIHFYSQDSKGKALKSSGKVHSLYYSTKNPHLLSCAPDFTPNKILTSFRWFKKRNSNYEEWCTSSLALTPNYIRECAKVRNAIQQDKEYKALFKSYPFKLSEQQIKGFPHPDIKSFFTVSGYQQSIRILTARRHLEANSIIVDVGNAECPKCKLALRLPKLLADSDPELDKLVCVDCGSRYLSNMVMSFMEKEVDPLFPQDDIRIWYDGYKLEEVFEPLEVSVPNLT